MIISIKLYPIRIPEGTTIDSTASLLFFDDNNYNEEDDSGGYHEWGVGTILLSPKQWYKLHVVEHIGAIVIHRFYITDGELLAKDTYIPLYMRIYAGDRSEMIVYRSGVTSMWQRYRRILGSQDISPMFVNHKIASTVINNQLGISGSGRSTDLIDAWAAYRNIYCPYSSEIDNGYQFYAEPEYDPYSPYIWQHNSEIYEENHDIYHEQYNFIDNITNYLGTGYSNGFYNGAPTASNSLITCDLLDYCVPEEYSPIAIDANTRRDLELPYATISHIAKGGSKFRSMKFANYTPRLQFDTPEVNVFHYDSTIIEICSCLLHCCYIEIHCTYILSTESLHIHTSTTCDNSEKNNDRRYKSFASSLTTALSRWGCTEVILLLTKTYIDTAHIGVTICHADGSTDSKTYTIDLSIVPAISHNITI